MAKGWVSRFQTADAGMDPLVFTKKYVAIMVLFCASGTGIIGAMTEGMTHDPNILLVKSIMDIFTAAGGFVMLAAGFRIAGIKSFPVANMLPALILVMPVSYLWTLLIY